MLVYYGLFAWALALLLAAWWFLTRETPEPYLDTPVAPPDPIETLVDKWAHDWERGRA